jgi:hypothetical protein
MERRFAALLFIFALGLGIYACSPGTRDDPLGSSSGGSSNGSGNGGSGGGGAPTPTPVMPTYSLLTNGVTGPWAGLPITAEITDNPSLSAQLVMAAGPVDPISGSTSTQITAKCDNAVLPGGAAGPCNVFTATPFLRLTSCPLFTAGTCPNLNLPVGYLQRAQMQFDLEVDLPQAQVGSIQLTWGNKFCGLHTYTLSVTQLSASFGSFAHYNIPLGSFLYPAGTTACGLPQTCAFQITLNRQGTSSTGNGFTISDVKWAAP